MNDLIIKIEKNTRKVDLAQSYLGNDHENLQEKLIFTFDEFVDGQARLEYEINNTKNYIILTKEDETYTIPVQNVLTIYQEDTIGKIQFQLVITEGTDDEEIPVFKSNIFYLRVRPSINAVNEAPEGYDLWIEQANTKLNQMDNFDIDATKVGSTTTVTITKRDGTEKSVEINDGVDVFIVTLTKEDDNIIANKTILETVQAYNSGKVIEGIYINEELGVPILLKPSFISSQAETSVVELSSLFDSGDDFNSIALLGFSENNTDSWSLFSRNIATTDDLNNYATKSDITVNLFEQTFTTSQAFANKLLEEIGNAFGGIYEDLDKKQTKSNMEQNIDYRATEYKYPSSKAVYDAIQAINPMFSVVMDESTMTLNHTASEIYEAFTQGKLVTAMGYTAFFKSYNNGVLQMSTYFGRSGQTITVQGNQITNVDEFDFVTQ